MSTDTNGDTLEITSTEPETADAPLPRRVIPHADAKLYKRTVQMLHKLGIGTLAVCLECQKAKRPEVIQYGRHHVTNEVVMLCGCATHLLEGITR